MSAAASSHPVGEPGASTWVDATPAAIRAVLAPESAAEFDRQWRAALDRAAETYDLSAVQACLDAWRRIARITVAAGGPAGYHELQQDASRRLATGDAGAASMSWRALRAELRL